MKNAYAIALGMADGLEQRTGLPHHNLRAALFPRAVTEMGALARAFGGRAETVFGLAGAGDLQVTITSGRNRLLGERIGQGDSPADAVQALAAGGTTVEGYRAADFGYRFYRQAVEAGILAEGSLPLLDALWRMLYRDAEPAADTLGRGLARSTPRPFPRLRRRRTAGSGTSCPGREDRRTRDRRVCQPRRALPS